VQVATHAGAIILKWVNAIMDSSDILENQVLKQKLEAEQVK